MPSVALESQSYSATLNHCHAIWDVGSSLCYITFRGCQYLMYWFMTYCRPFVRSCLFQPVERGRLSKVMQQAATQASVTSLLENHAVVEIAAQAAISRQWDR